MSPAPPIAQSPFDLAALRSSLPAPSYSSPQAFTPPPSFADQAPTSSWATDFLTHASKPSVANSLQSATPRQYQGYSTQDQMYHPSLSHGASHPALAVKSHVKTSSRSSPASVTHAYDVAGIKFCASSSNNNPSLYGLPNRQ